MNASEIRLMREEDIPSYHRCLDLVARERRYLSMLEALPMENTRAWLLPLLAQNRPVFVAVEETRVVGWCDITPKDRVWFAHRGTLGMGVHPEYRRRGLGTRLLQAALAHARAIGLERVELEVFASNRAARRLYETIGFRVEGTLPRALKSDTGYDDVILMAHLLNG
jgi:RimJ/RimL family protein N-acetyltransferase